MYKIAAILFVSVVVFYEAKCQALLWKKTEKQNTVQGYIDFVRRRPNNGNYAAKAQEHACDILFSRSGNSEWNLESFIKSCPDHSKVNVAIERIDSLLFRNAEYQNIPEAYAEYLTRGRHTHLKSVAIHRIDSLLWDKMVRKESLILYYSYLDYVLDKDNLLSHLSITGRDDSVLLQHIQMASIVLNANRDTVNGFSAHRMYEVVKKIFSQSDLDKIFKPNSKGMVTANFIVEYENGGSLFQIDSTSNERVKKIEFDRYDGKHGFPFKRLRIWTNNWLIDWQQGSDGFWYKLKISLQDFEENKFSVPHAQAPAIDNFPLKINKEKHPRFSMGIGGGVNYMLFAGDGVEGGGFCYQLESMLGIRVAKSYASMITFGVFGRLGSYRDRIFKTIANKERWDQLDEFNLPNNKYLEIEGGVLFGNIIRFSGGVGWQYVNSNLQFNQLDQYYMGTFSIGPPFRRKAAKHNPYGIVTPLYVHATFSIVGITNPLRYQDNLDVIYRVGITAHFQFNFARF